MRRAAPAPAVLLAALALAACGDSAEENAQNTVCDARADISEKVDELKAMTPETFTVDDATAGLSAIRADLTQIKDAQGELSDDRREQVSSANEAFESEVTQIADQVGGSASLSDAKSQLSAAFQQLADSYEQTFARVPCS